MPRVRDRDMKALLCLLAIVFIVNLIGFPREEYQADLRAARFETVSLINNGSLAIPESIATGFGHSERGQFFYQNTARNESFSKYGIINGLIYIPPLLVEKWYTGELPYRSGNRAIFLNFYNLVLSLASAAYLYGIARKYTSSTPIIFIYILTAFYCTFWWNYLRAQNFEIYQTLFLLAAYYHLTAYSAPPGRGARARPESHLILAGIFLSALILAKLFYAILLPGVFLFIAVQEWHRADKRLAIPLRFAWLGLPLACALGLTLALDFYKFGSAFSTGYDQWGQRGKPIFSGNFLAGFGGFLFDPQYSIFLYFPILTLALPGYRRFFARFPYDGLLFSCMGATLLLVESNMIEWRGTWGYGPRYLLAVLPLVSLPFIQTLELLAVNLRKRWAMACSAFMALFLLYTFHMQLNVNALPFFTYFQVQSLFTRFHDPKIDEYFASRDFGSINADIIAYKAGGPWVVDDDLAQALTPESRASLRQFIIRLTPPNYYFWPGPPLPPPSSPSSTSRPK